LSVLVFCQLAGLHEKLPLVSGLSKDIHSVWLGRCQEKNSFPSTKSRVLNSLKHASRRTPELEHETAWRVNGFTPNRLILTIFNDMDRFTGTLARALIRGRPIRFQSYLAWAAQQQG
jgi:hypothetical protein